MRISRPALLLGSLVFLIACYQQPEIPRDRPLSCTSDEPGECPAGFSCIEKRICAPDSCEVAEDCPEGLVCGRDGCALPGADGGTDMATPAATPDAPAPPPDAGLVFDVGGGS